MRIPSSSPTPYAVLVVAIVRRRRRLVGGQEGRGQALEGAGGRGGGRRAFVLGAAAAPGGPPFSLGGEPEGAAAAGLAFHPDLAAEQPDPARCFAFTTRGSRRFDCAPLRPGDWFVFGSEGSGLAPELRERFAPEQRLRLPMREGQRSLNLSNAVAVTVFEAWRQQGWAGGV